MIIIEEFRLLAFEIARRWDAEVLGSWKPKHHALLEMAARPRNNDNNNNNDNVNHNNKIYELIIMIQIINLRMI